jgi:hypothetical protein
VDAKLTDEDVLRHIERLVAEEDALYGQHAPQAADAERLKRINVALDRCWDLLRQRRPYASTAAIPPRRSFARPT